MGCTALNDQIPFILIFWHSNSHAFPLVNNQPSISPFLPFLEQVSLLGGAEHAKSSNRWILEEFHFERHDSFDFCAGIWVVSPPLSIDTLDVSPRREAGGVAPASASIRLRLPPPPQPQHGVAALALQPIKILYGLIYYDDAKPRPR